MAFQRTNSGLNNQHHFYGVDYVVYVEGGESLSEDTVLNGGYNDNSIDKMYWEKILSFYSNKKFKVKPIGSKSTLIKLINRFLSGNVNNNLVCTDSEFDEINNTKIVSNKIIYSYGYSWENDVWNSELIRYIIDQFSAVENDFDEIKSNYLAFIEGIKEYVSLDAALFSTDKRFFPRPSGHQKLINCNPNEYPELKENEFNKIIESLGLCSEKQQLYKSKFDLNPQKYCYGHLLNDFCKNYIKFFMKVKHDINSLADELIRRFAISNFLSFTENQSKIIMYQF